MKQVFVNRLHLSLVFALMLLMFLSVTGCQDAHAESTECSSEDGHDHEAEAEDEHVEAEEDHSDHDNEATEDHDNEDELEEETAIELSERNIEAAGIEFALAGPGSIDQHTQLLGEIAMNNDQISRIVPPVAGIVEEIRVQVGDQVQAGDVLVVLSSRDLADARAEYLHARSSFNLSQTVYSNQQELFEAEFLSEQEFLISRQEYTEANIEFQTARQSLSNLGLSEYEIGRISSGSLLTRQELRAPISGTVVHLSLAPGEIVGDEMAVLTVADLTSVWVELQVLQTDIASVRAGQSLTVFASEASIPEATTVLDFVSPVIERSTRTASARAELPNPDGYWMPGLFVNAQVATSVNEVPIVVNREAVQSLDGETVVFVPHEEAFEIVPVELGQSNRTHVEIMHGLSHGDRYVSKGAFALKAEIVTSGLDSHAGHGH